MAVANTKSTLVTNADAAVQALNVAGLAQARVYSAMATVEVAAADDDGSVYRFMRVHSSWRMRSITVFCDAITGGTAYEVGLYQTAANGGAVVDADCYASAITLATAITAGSEVLHEARDINKIGQQVWQDAGAAADTDRWYDLALTGTTVGTAAGTISVAIEYTAGA